MVQDIYSFTNNIENIPKLNQHEKELCNRNISENELLECLKSFKNNKSPGNDGLTKEFYLTFWNELCKPLIDSYQYSFSEGCLSTSQRQAIITLLE